MFLAFFVQSSTFRRQSCCSQSHPTNSTHDFYVMHNETLGLSVCLLPHRKVAYAAPVFFCLFYFVLFHIVFKVAMTMHNIFHQCSLPYLVRPLHIHRQWIPASSTTVVSSQVCRCPWSSNSVCGLDGLPVNIRLIYSHAAFWRALKTHLSNTAFI